MSRNWNGYAALNELLGDREGYQLQQNIAAVIRASATASADAIDEKLLELQQELLKKANSKEAYDEIADEIFRLRELKQQTTVDTVARDEQIKRLTELQDFIRSQPAELTEFDETLVRRWFKQITVYPEQFGALPNVPPDKQKTLLDGERAEAEQDSQQSGSETVPVIRFHRRHQHRIDAHDNHNQERLEA